jgi:putative ABC transport system permease protein
LTKRPGYALVAILTIAVGIGAATAVFSVVNKVLLEPLAFGEADQLVTVTMANPARNIEGTGMSGPDLVDFRAGMSSLAGLETWNWFGRTFRPEETEADHVVVVSHGFWTTELGADPAIAGKQITLDERPWTVIGVMPASFVFPAQEVQFWIPVDVTRQTERAGRRFGAVGRLKPGVSLAAAEAEGRKVSAVLASQYPATNQGFELRLQPMKETVIGEVRGSLILLLGAVGLLVLVGAANVTNLMLARGMGRRQELAARLALGASRGQVMSLALAESTLVAVAGGVLGVVLAGWGTAVLAQLNPADLPRASEVAVDGRALLVSVLLIVFSGPVAGLLPAWQLAQTAPGAALSRGGRGTAGGVGASRTRRILTVAELAFALILLVGAGLMLKSFIRVSSQDPGFEPRRALAVQLFVFGPKYQQPAETRIFFDQLLTGLRAVPGVVAAGAVNALPLSEIQGGTREAEIDGRAEPEKQRVGLRIVTPGYLEALGRRLVMGRELGREDGPEGVRVALVNETAARAFFPGKSPIGERIRIVRDTAWAEIVGVVGDIRQEGLEVAVQPEVLFPFDQRTTGMMSVVARTSGDPRALLEAAQEEVWKVDPTQAVYRAAALEDWAYTNTQRRRFLTWLVGIFAGLALLLASVGIYGVISYSVAQQTREMALRLALGASPGQVRSLVLWDGLKLTLVGLAIGLGVSLLGARLVASLLFEVSPKDPPTLALVAALLGVVALLACLPPAERAARVAPFESLREG